MRSYVVLACVLAGLLIAPSAQAAALFKSANVTELGHAARGGRRDRRALQPRREHDVRHERDRPGHLRRQRPEAPQRLSRLPLPHFENEDVDVGHIGGATT